MLTFSDTFRRFRPWTGHRGVWRTVYGDRPASSPAQRTLSPNGELQLYVDADMADSAGAPGLNPFSVRRHRLRITAARTPDALRPRLGGYAFTSGLITSQPSFSQAYGYFEMRARLPRGKGLWPAFWMLPADMSCPPELDVMESIGDPSVIYATAHTAGVAARPVEIHITPDRFHTFAVSWSASSLAWYVDGVRVARQPTPPDMHKPMFMLVNLAVGGNWPGSPDASTPFPADYSIAFIRAYRFGRRAAAAGPPPRQAQSPEQVTAPGSFASD